MNKEQLDLITILTIISLFLLSLYIPASSHAWTPKAGDLFHITGCENGELVVPTVYLWSKPGGATNGAKVVG
jgi:hypothetical protein